MRHRFFMLLIRLHAPDVVYYPLLNLAYPELDLKGWRPLRSRTSAKTTRQEHR